MWRQRLVLSHGRKTVYFPIEISAVSQPGSWATRSNAANIFSVLVLSWFSPPIRCASNCTQHSAAAFLDSSCEFVRKKKHNSFTQNRINNFISFSQVFWFPLEATKHKSNHLSLRNNVVTTNPTVLYGYNHLKLFPFTFFCRRECIGYKVITCTMIFYNLSAVFKVLLVSYPGTRQLKRVH